MVDVNNSMDTKAVPSNSAKNGSSATKSKKSRSRNKKNKHSNAQSVANGAGTQQTKPEAQDLVAAVAAAVEGPHSTKDTTDHASTNDVGVDREIRAVKESHGMQSARPKSKSAQSSAKATSGKTSNPNSPSRKSNTSSPTKTTRSYAAAAASPATAQVSATVKDSLDSLMESGDTNMLTEDRDKDEIPRVETPVEGFSLLDVSPPTGNGVQQGAAQTLSSVSPPSHTDYSAPDPVEETAPQEEDRYDDLRVADEPAANHVISPTVSKEVDVSRDGVVEEAALTDGGVEEAEKVYGDKARIAPPEPSLDTSSVLSESDTLALDDPIVAVSRSMSVQAPMDTYAEALANGVSCEVHGLVM